QGPGSRGTAFADATGRRAGRSINRVPDRARRTVPGAGRGTAAPAGPVPLTAGALLPGRPVAGGGGGAARLERRGGRGQAGAGPGTAADAADPARRGAFGGAGCRALRECAVGGGAGGAGCFHQYGRARVRRGDLRNRGRGGPARRGSVTSDESDTHEVD